MKSASRRSHSMRILKQVTTTLISMCCLLVCHARAAEEQPATREAQDSRVTLLQAQPRHEAGLESAADLGSIERRER